MEILLILASVCMVLFMILATYDGFYLHIFKYGLFNHEESTFEHKTHTVRAILFPAIVWLLFVNETSFGLFLLGVGLVLLDLVVLAIDAYSETESRKFMGGLPKWEYIIHLFSNSLHFAAIMLVLAMKIDLVNGGLVFVSTIPASFAKEVFVFVSVNLIPGSILLALVHFILLVERPRVVWNTYRSKISCC